MIFPNKKGPKPSKNSVKERSHGFAVSRRTFLGVTAGVGAAIAAKRLLKPGVGLALDLELDKPPYGIVTEKWISTSCLNCPTRCATKVRVINDKAVRIIGNPLSKVSEGETCPRSHVGLQVLYDPDRVYSPLRRTNPKKGRGMDPGWVPITWEQALDDVTNHLRSLRAMGEPHKLLLLHGLNTISAEDLISRFASAYGTPNVISGDGLEDEADKAGEWMADGHYTQSAYDLENTNYILAFGANITESQRPLARNLRMWGKMRRERPNRAKIVVIDPRYSITAAKADQWIPIKPGTDGALALAMANVIIREDLYNPDFVKDWTTGFDDYRALVLSKYAPEDIVDITGINADTTRSIAREFAKTRPAIAWRGKGATSWPDGSYTSYAIFCLNALVGSIDIPGGVIYQEYPNYQHMPEVIEDSVAKEGKAKPRIDLAKSVDFPAAGVVTNQVADSILADKSYITEIAIGFNCNFNMSAPGTGRWDEAMAKLPYYVHIAPALTEMGQYADIVLPACTFLEEWAYDHCPPGSGFAEAKIKQPVVKPLGEAKSTVDIIFALANGVGSNVSRSFVGIGGSAEEFVKYRTSTLMPWNEFRDRGVWVGRSYVYGKYDTIFETPSKKFEFYSGNMGIALKEIGKVNGDNLAAMPHYKRARFLGDESKYPLALVTYHPLLNIESGNQNYPWAQEIFLVMHGQGWANFVEINRETARAIKIKDMDSVWVESSFGKIKAKARVFEGIRPEVVAIAVGQGHYACGRWADEMGVNPNDVIGVDYDHISGQSAFYNTRVKVYKA